MLDRWALRREKVLEKLDIRAATKARELARACQEFSVWRERVDVSDMEAHFVWQELRERVLSVLEESHRSSCPPPSAPSSSVSGTRRAQSDAAMPFDPRRESDDDWTPPRQTVGRGR